MKSLALSSLSTRLSTSRHRLLLAVALGAAILAQTSDATGAIILAPHSNWEYTFSDPTGSATWNTTTGGWTVGPAPFGNNTGLDADFDYATLWTADGDDGDDLWVRTAVDLTGYDLSTVGWDLGVDNGYKLYLNGALISADNGEGYTFRWEYSGGFTGLVSGVNVIAVALEDHGGATAFDMQMTGTPVPEPGTIFLLGAGIAGLAFARRRRK